MSGELELVYQIVLAATDVGVKAFLAYLFIGLLKNVVWAAALIYVAKAIGAFFGIIKADILGK